MIYTIDAGYLYTDYRLKKDGSFKEFKGKHFKDVEEDDKLFTDYNEVKSVAKTINEIKVNGEVFDLRTGSLGNMHLKVRPHRTGKPTESVFTREDLRQVLLGGNDNRNNSLIVDFNGNLQLIPFETVRTTPHAVRYESFQAGNGYVGPKSELNHLERTYLGLLEGWAGHLFSHDSIYVDYTDNFDEQKKLEEINDLVEKL